MEFAAMMTLPGLVICLTVVAFLDQLMLRAGRAGLLPWRNSARQGQVSATGFEQLHATFSPGKQSELKERQSALLLRDDEEDGAPPHRSTVDLDGGLAVIRMPGREGGGGDGAAESAAAPDGRPRREWSAEN